MTAQSTLSKKLPEKLETKQATSAPVAPQKAAPDTRTRAYWGDRWTFIFWLCCFALMAGMNLVEAVRNFVLYLFGGSTPP
jgi:hypothetical protein